MDQPSRVAVVTGAAQGIGLAIARRFLADGWAVLSADLQPTSLPADLATRGAAFHAVAVDLTTPAAADIVVGTAMSRFGRLDLLVNNAGIGNAQPVHKTTDEELHRFLETNFAALFRLSREALAVMEPGAAIIHIASVLGLVGTPSTSAYAATKAAVIGLTRQMAAEYGPRGIRTNAIAPGLVETALTAERLQSNPVFRRIWAEGTPWPRLGRPEDIAGAARFLASPDAEFINGHVLVVDGGWSVGAPG